MADYPWRPLGEVLVERGLIDHYDLEVALTAQRMSGRPLGEVMVARGLVSPVDLAAAIAAQQGVSLQAPAGTVRAAGQSSTDPWRPLGRMLVDKDLLTESGLQRVLAEQRRHGGMLGEILVRRGYVSAAAIAAALAEQHGLEVDTKVLERVTPAKPAERRVRERYEVCAAEEEIPLHVSGSFLDAADFAFELLDADDPDALEILRVDEDGRSVVWSYSREAAEAARGGG